MSGINGDDKLVKRLFHQERTLDVWGGGEGGEVLQESTLTQIDQVIVDARRSLKVVDGEDLLSLMQNGGLDEEMMEAVVDQAMEDGILGAEFYQIYLMVKGHEHIGPEKLAGLAVEMSLLMENMSLVQEDDSSRALMVEMSVDMARKLGEMLREYLHEKEEAIDWEAAPAAEFGAERALRETLSSLAREEFESRDVLREQLKNLVVVLDSYLEEMEG